MSDYYTILGVDREATRDEIKQAYKYKAQTIHPDKGGGEDEFKLLNEAYRCLVNTEKRARYDAGEDVSQPRSTFEDTVMNRLAGMFQQAADNAKDEVDPVNMVRESAARAMPEVIKDMDEQRGIITKMEKLRPRVKYTGDGVDLFHGVIDQKIDLANRQIEVLNDELDVVKAVLERLNDYDCVFTAERQGPITQGSFPGNVGIGARPTTSWPPG